MTWVVSCGSDGRRWADVSESDGEGSEDDVAAPRRPSCRNHLEGSMAKKIAPVLNAGAVEFVPMFTMPCPADGFFCMAECSASVELGLTEMVLNVVEEEWRHRTVRRQKEIAVLTERLARHGLCIEEEPALPDATDQSISRRQWKRDVDVWFKASLLLRIEEKPVSLASTEEAHSQAHLADFSPSSASDCTHVADTFDSDGECLDEEQTQALSSDVDTVLHLNADAPEFLPTLTMYCPLVAVCCMVAPSGDVPLAAEPLAPETLLSCLPHADQQDCADASLSNVTEDEWQHRLSQRQKGLDLLSERLAARGFRDDKELATPDPADRSISRRQWKREVDTWFKASYSLCMEEGSASVASTWDSTAEAGSQPSSRTTFDDQSSNSK